MISISLLIWKFSPFFLTFICLYQSCGRSICISFVSPLCAIETSNPATYYSINISQQRWKNKNKWINKISEIWEGKKEGLIIIIIIIVFIKFPHSTVHVPWNDGKRKCNAFSFVVFFLEYVMPLYSFKCPKNRQGMLVFTCIRHECHTYIIICVHRSNISHSLQKTLKVFVKPPFQI